MRTFVTHVDAEGESVGELLLASAQLLECDPGEIRAVVDRAADAAANDAATRDAQEAGFIANWTAALRSAP